MSKTYPSNNRIHSGTSNNVFTPQTLGGVPEGNIYLVACISLMPMTSVIFDVLSTMTLGCRSGAVPNCLVEYADGRALMLSPSVIFCLFCTMTLGCRLGAIPDCLVEYMRTDERARPPPDARTPCVSLRTTTFR